MKKIIIVAALTFSFQIFAAPVCHLDITKNDINQRTEIILIETQNPNADIPGYFFNVETDKYTLSIFNTDGNYNGTLIIGRKSVEASVTDEDLILELDTSDANYLITCPKYIF